MSNSLNSNPIIIDTDLTGSNTWRATQTLNTGKFPATAQGPNPTFRQPGIRPYRIQIIAVSSTTAGTILVTDPNDSTVLWTGAVASTVAAGTIIIDESWDNSHPSWRDFIVSGLTASATKMLLWYRN